MLARQFLRRSGRIKTCLASPPKKSDSRVRRWIGSTLSQMRANRSCSALRCLPRGELC